MDKLVNVGVSKGERFPADLLRLTIAEAAGAKVTGIHGISYEYDDGGYMIAKGCAPAMGGIDDEAPEFNPDDVYVECEVRMQWSMEV